MWTQLEGAGPRQPGREPPPTPPAHLSWLVEWAGHTQGAQPTHHHCPEHLLSCLIPDPHVAHAASSTHHALTSALICAEQPDPAHPGLSRVHQLRLPAALIPAALFCPHHRPCPLCPGGRRSALNSLTQDEGAPEAGSGAGLGAPPLFPPGTRGPGSRCPGSTPGRCSCELQVAPFCFCCSESFHRFLLGP